MMTGGVNFFFFLFIYFHNRLLNIISSDILGSVFVDGSEETFLSDLAFFLFSEESLLSVSLSYFRGLSEVSQSYDRNSSKSSLIQKANDRPACADSSARRLRPGLSPISSGLSKDSAKIDQPNLRFRQKTPQQ